MNPDPHSSPPGLPTAGDGSLDGIRDELRRKGYLSHGVERYLLQDAVRPVQWRGAVLRLALKLGGLGGVAMAGLSTLLLMHWNPSLQREPLDTVPLFLHLLPLWSVLFCVFFLLLAGVLALLLRRYPGLRIHQLSLNLTVIGVSVALGGAVWAGGRDGLGLLHWPGWLLALVAALGAYLVARLIYSGLLALSIHLSHRSPLQPADQRRWLLLLLAVLCAAVVVLPASLLSDSAPEMPSVLPQKAGGRVLLIGVDGVLASEFDYLLDRGELPVVAKLLASEGVLATYDRPDVDPAAFWTSVATGLPSPIHGVAAVDNFRPLGLRSALGTSGPFRAYWSRVVNPLGLAEHRPVLANRRSADTFWELTARGGAPVLVVNWWSTYPARELSGTVVAHGAYQLLTDETPGAVAPATEAAALKALRDDLGTTGAVEIVRSALGEGGEPLIERALRPEALYRTIFRTKLSISTRAAAIYLPALDLAGADWSGGEVPFADLVRSELQAADQLLGAALSEGPWNTVVVVADPGRRAGSQGRVLLWRTVGCRRDPAFEVTPEAVAAALLRGLGLPQSAEIPEPPGACHWEPPAVTIESFGRRRGGPVSMAQGEEYLESLRALGYL